MAINLMIVDDHAGMRETIRQLVATPGDNVKECASGDEAVKLLPEFKPDCAMVDVSMPGLCAFKTMQEIHKAHPSARIVCVTSHDQPEYRRAAFEAGASGFVVKDNLADLYLIVATKRLLSRMRL